MFGLSDLHKVQEDQVLLFLLHLLDHPGETQERQITDNCNPMLHYNFY